MLKLASSSYIWQADIVTNIKKLKDYVKGIQILFFEMSDEQQMDNPIDVEELIRFKKKYGLTYFIHMPLNIDFYSNISETIKKNKPIIDIGEKIGVDYYVFHIEENPESNYNKICLENIKKFLNICSIKEKFLIENISNNFDFLDYFINKLNINLCLDIGHLYQQNIDLSIIENYKDKIKLVHLHDLNNDGNDHYYLNNIERNKQAILLLNKINYRGYVILEIFSKEYFFKSLEFLKKLN
jgi:sugar phosphate isomerase/epimerase